MYEIHDDAHPGDSFRVAAADKEAAQELYIEWREACEQVHGNLRIRAIGYDMTHAYSTTLYRTSSRSYVGVWYHYNPDHEYAA